MMIGMVVVHYTHEAHHTKFVARVRSAPGRRRGRLRRAVRNGGGHARVLPAAAAAGAD